MVTPEAKVRVGWGLCCFVQESLTPSRFQLGCHLLLLIIGV